MYDKTITILNKLKKADTQSKLTDEWYKTVIHGVDFKKTTVRTVSGTTVSIGQTVIILIPFSKGYFPYTEWKENHEGFTVSNGDIVLLGIEISENPTSQNVTALKTQYSGVECKVVEVAVNNGMARVQVKIEGV